MVAITGCAIVSSENGRLYEVAAVGGKPYRVIAWKRGTRSRPRAFVKAESRASRPPPHKPARIYNTQHEQDDRCEPGASADSFPDQHRCDWRGGDADPGDRRPVAGH